MSTPSAPAVAWVHAPAVDWVLVDGEAVLHDRARRTLHVLNATATEVWAAIDGRPFDDIVDGLVRRYPEAASEVERDVRSTVSRLARLGVILRV